MANAIYPKYKEGLLTSAANTDIEAGNVKAILVDLADYTYSSAHDFRDDVASGAIVATSGNLASKTITNGVFDSADFTFTAVTGDVSEAIIIYIDTGTASTSPLVAFYDTGVTGLPVTPNGGDINVTVNASGWFAL
jgi:hypothetical protein